MKKIIIYAFIISLLACKNDTKTKLINTLPEDAKINDKEEFSDSKDRIEENLFYQFKPDSITNAKIENVSIDYSYEIDGYKIIIGYYEPVDGKLSKYETETDYGDRLFFLNKKNELLYKGAGQGDVYLYEPYFYRNNKSDKIIIVCQLAFEYNFGGDVFLLENNKISPIGNIDVESIDMETKLVDILKIKELNDKIVFSFKSDSLLLKPGNEDIQVKNNNLRYEYANKTLRLIDYEN